MNTPAVQSLTLQAVPARREGLHLFYTDAAGKRIQLNSAFNPVEEAKKAAETIDPPATGKLLLVGVGAGDLALAILHHLQDVKVIGVEACPQTAVLCHDSPALREAVRNPRFSYIGPDSPALIPTLAAYDGPFFCSRAWLGWYEHTAPRAAEIVWNWQIEKQSQEAFGELRNQNMMHNIERFGDFAGVDILQGLTEGRRPVLMAAAGASLDDHMETLRRLSHRGHTVVAVDAAFAPLYRAGVRVQVVVSIDPQPKAVDFFPPDFPIPILVTTLRAASGLLELPSKVTLVSYPKTAPFNQLEAKLPRGLLETGGSVASAAFDVAQQLGGSKIGLLGADFCYLKATTHVQGSKACGPVSAFHPKTLKLVKTQRNHDAFSTPLLIGFAKHLEEMIQQAPVPVVNFSDGLPLPGASPGRLEDWLH